MKQSVNFLILPLINCFLFFLKGQDPSLIPIAKDINRAGISKIPCGIKQINNSSDESDLDTFGLVGKAPIIMPFITADNIGIRAKKIPEYIVTTEAFKFCKRILMNK